MKAYRMLVVVGGFVAQTACGAGEGPGASSTTSGSTTTIPSTAGITVGVAGLSARTPLGSPVELQAALPAGTTASAFHWSATCGELATSEGESVTWTAPSSASTCEVSVVASLNGEEATGAASTRASYAIRPVGSDVRGDGTEAGFDVLDTYYGVEGDTLYLEAAFAELDPKKAQLEVFFLRTTANQDIYSVGLKSGSSMCWFADRPAGHPHYHWQQVSAPKSLRIEADDALLTVEIALADVGLDGETAARIGLAGAPHVVSKTANYTDRLPDALLVTGTDVDGLSSLDLQ